MQISAIMQLFSELFGINPFSAALTFVQVNQANTAKAQGYDKKSQAREVRARRLGCRSEFLFIHHGAD